MTPEERFLLESEDKRAMNIGAGALIALLLAAVVLAVAVTANPPYPQSIFALLAILIAAFVGGSLCWAFISIRVGLILDAKTLGMKRRPDLFDRFGFLMEDPAQPPVKSAVDDRTQSLPESGRELLAPGTSPSLRPCPHCGTMNQRDWQYCQKCAKSLPPPV
jgi:hypothetical protein